MLLERQGPIGSHPLRLAEIPDPVPGPDEILVRVAACGVCRTDLHIVEGDLPARRLPLVPGHQVVGTVAAVGEGCERFRIGDRAGIAWLRGTCGVCAFCRSGSENLCEQSRYTGWHEDGGYAEYAVVPEAYAYPLPAALDDEAAAPLLCAGIIGYRALTRSEVPSGGRLALFGFGSSAHLVLQLALSRGCEVFVATRGQRHRALARELGAAWVGDTFDPAPALADGAIVFAPAGEVVPAALRAVRHAGTVVLAGVTMTPVPGLDYETCLFHEKKLTSVEANTRADGEALFREAATARIRPRTRTFRLDEANEVLRRLSQDRVEGTAILAIGGA